MTMDDTAVHPFEKALFVLGGYLEHGSHPPGAGLGCALEVASLARGGSWSDIPWKVGLPDLRAINDADWTSPFARTRAMVPVVEALWDWPLWSRSQRQRWLRAVVMAFGNYCHTNFGPVDESDWSVPRAMTDMRVGFRTDAELMVLCDIMVDAATIINKENDND